MQHDSPYTQSNKHSLRNLARATLGLDIRLAASRDYDIKTYEGNFRQSRRLLYFEHLLKQVEHIEGRIVECGVGPGRSIFAFSLLTQFVVRPREIWGFDTFNGIPPPTAEDGKANRDRAGTWKHPQEEVIGLLEHNGLGSTFIRENITFVPGLLSDSLPRYDGGAIALLHLDIDFYESYRTALGHLWPHVAEGGLVVFDEYLKSSWPGATQAVDEFFADRPEEIVLTPVLDRYCVVKQPSIVQR